MFAAVYLDARHGLIDMEEITRGSLTRMAVYPREIVRRAIAYNAAALIVAHNHPSGAVQPSAEDRRLTRALHDALALVDVRLLDHVVIGTSDTFRSHGPVGCRLCGCGPPNGAATVMRN